MKMKIMMKLRIKNWLRNTSEVLKELLLGILIYGGIAWLIGLLFVTEKWLYTRGLWVGALTAMGMALHMDRTVEYVLELTPEGAEKYWRSRSVMRMMMAMAVLAVVVYFQIGSVIPCFIGVMGLKVAAYIQPFTHKLLSARR